MYPYQPPIQIVFYQIQHHFFYSIYLFSFVCTFFYLLESPVIWENLFLFMIVCENLFLFNLLEYLFAFYECAKFPGSRGIVGFVGLLPPCRRAFDGSKKFFVGISWVQNIFSLVFREFQIFSRGYFVGPIFFSRGYFVGP